MYFYYRRTITGKWTPQTAVDEPRKDKNNATLKVVGVRSLGPEDAGLTLDQLAKKYPDPDATGKTDVPATLEPATAAVEQGSVFARPTAPIDAILGDAIDVLDHGFVRVVDYMGNDAAIVQMARVSYGEGTKTPSDDRSLIRYLMRHDHTSPFEGCEIKLHLKMPIFVARQWIRHRTANVNEISGRYSILKDEFFVPAGADLRKQSVTNRQGRADEDAYSEAQKRDILWMLSTTAGEAFAHYDRLVSEEFGLSRELARIHLPLSTYTEFYWKIDLHNLFHFLRLRADGHAQQEIRAYAEVIEGLVARWVPIAFEAYVDYRRDAVKFSRMEFDALRRWIAATWPEDPEYGGAGPVDFLTGLGVSDRELKEFEAKFRKGEA